MLEKEIRKNIVANVEPNSIAEEVGIEEGDILTKINDKKINDVIDYLYQISDEYLEIEVEKKDGETWVIEIEKEYDEDLGISFENPILDNAKSCSNKCIFCFIDQLPKGMRKSLYFKDDDSRLSFLQGNFVTLTNISDEEFNRIIEFNISPINVSIHTTNPELRVKMLNNKKAGNVLDRLKVLTSNRVIVNGQIVLCPDVNDGEELDNTIKDLYSLYPNLQSIAVVPVGLTKFREKLFEFNTFTQKSAFEVVNKIEKWQDYLLKNLGSRFIYAADEFYLMANMELPSYSEYESFPQIENGVGLLRKFENEYSEYLYSLNNDPKLEKKLSIATGISASSFLQELMLDLKSKYPKVEVTVFPIINNYFGDKITVSGLITGTDIIHQLKNKSLGEKLILPKSMFKAKENILLDNITDSDIAKELSTNVEICEINGKELIECLLK